MLCFFGQANVAVCVRGMPCANATMNVGISVCVALLELFANFASRIWRRYNQRRSA